MKSDIENRAQGDRSIYLSFWVLLAGFTVYLVVNHYVKAYSDPQHWLRRAEWMFAGIPEWRRPPIYPFVLGLLLRALGPALVFLANLPFEILLLAILYSIVGQILRDDAHKDLPVARLGGLVAVGFMIVFRHDLMLELLNPFREPLSMSLMLGGVSAAFAGLRSRRSWWMALSGCLLGLATGTRETSVLVFPLVGLLLLYFAAFRREISFWRAALAFALGSVLGLLPFLINNAVFSGHFWVPSYASHKMVGGAAASTAAATFKDIPVPGMSLRYFPRVGVQTAAYFWRVYGPVGALAWIAGVVIAIRKRYWRVLLVCVPGALGYALFYSFYSYVKGRYLFSVDIFLIPVAAVGFIGILEMVAARIASAQVKIRLIRWTARLGVLLVLGLLAVSTLRRPSRFRVWDIAAFREAVEAKIETPCLFVSVGAHRRELLAWVLRGEQSALGTELSAARVQEVGLEEALRELSVRVLDCVRTNRVYSYGNSWPVPLRSWVDFEEVVDFSTLEVAPDHYGKRFNSKLYRVRPWSEHESRVRLQVTGDDPYRVLAVNGYRLWDYPGRTYCRLYANGELLEDRVPNGLHFVEWKRPEGQTQIHLRFESDQPLPASPRVEWLPSDGRLSLPLGTGTKAWAYPLLSPELTMLNPLRPDSCLLTDRGTILVPKYGSAGQELFATLRVEYFCGGWRCGKPVDLTLRAGDRARVDSLSNEQRIEWVEISLGPGTGRLEWVPVELESTLPPFAQQREWVRQGKIDRYGVVKLYTLRVDPVVSPERSGRYVMDIGERGDTRFVVDGCYSSEPYDRTFVRWTSGEAIFRVPATHAPAGAVVRVESMGVRPDADKVAVRFYVDGQAIAPSSISMRRTDKGQVWHQFPLPGPVSGASETVELKLVVPSWVPAEVTGTPDRRELGIMVDRILIEPADASSES